jgi:hypothetical protein
MTERICTDLHGWSTSTISASGPSDLGTKPRLRLPVYQTLAKQLRIDLLMLRLRPKCFYDCVRCETMLSRL